MMCEISQSQKAKYRRSPFIRGAWRGQDQRDSRQDMGARVGGAATGTQFRFCKMKRALWTDGGDGCLTRECT